MAGRFTGVRLSLEPAANAPNWILDAPSATDGFLKSVLVSGELGHSARCLIRVNRASGQSGAGVTTGAPVSKWGLAADAPNGIRFYSGYATTVPTLAAGAIVARALNLHGGVIAWNFADSEILLDGNSTPSVDTTIACINDSGFGANAMATHSVVWEEV
jgi:hypothetical protein